MKRVIVALLLSLTSLAASAQTVSELSNQGLVLLASHADEKSVVTLIMGTIDGGPEYICITRYRVGANDDYDQCRKIN